MALLAISMETPLLRKKQNIKKSKKIFKLEYYNSDLLRNRKKNNNIPKQKRRSRRQKEKKKADIMQKYKKES